MIKTILINHMAHSLLHSAVDQVSGLHFVFACGRVCGLAKSVVRWEPPWCLPMELSIPLLLRGPAFPFFIKKRKQEIECKTLQRLVSHRSCEFNHTPARK